MTGLSFFVMFLYLANLRTKKATANRDAFGQALKIEDEVILNRTFLYYFVRLDV